MPALSFTLERKIVWILDPCRDGEGQTIRPAGKRKYRAGDRLYLYAHQRTKNCRKLGEAVCSEVMPMTMVCRPSPVFPYERRILLYGEFARAISYDGFALADGFNNFREMEQFFINTYKLKPGDSKEMVIIKWKDFVATNKGERRNG